MKAKLIYSAIASLDGYVEDTDGKFDWAAPDPEVHAFVNELERPVGVYLYGRRMYETMVYWEMNGEHHPVARDYAQVWRAAEKIVFSRTLHEVSSARTRIERTLTPDLICSLKESSPTPISIGGAELAAQAFAAGLVDELHLLVNPVIVGSGKPSLPRDLHARLELLSECSFANGVVHLHYRL